MFNLDNTTPQASNGSYLAGNAIHKVKFVEATKAEVGKDKLPVVRIKFEDVEGKGAFEDTIFEPKSSERERGGPNNYESASQMEQFQAKLRQYIAAVNPKLDKEINEGTKKLGAKDWDGMRDMIVAALMSKGKNVGVETSIKLLKNKAGYAQAPGFVAGLTKEGKVFHRTKFVGEDLSFTDQEMVQINKANTSAPTQMANTNDDLGGGNDTISDDLSFELDDL